MLENQVFQSTFLKQFKESKIKFKPDPDAENKVVNIYPEMKYQKVLGFGSAFTDSSAANYIKMSPERRDEFMKLYFDKKDGLGLNFCRTHINSCDFSEAKYTYVAEGDKFLDSFDISHDKERIMPMIARAKQFCSDELMLFCSPWSPPAFMKSNGNMLLGGRLLPEYFESWANYYVKYIQSFKENGIDIWGLTVQNEPMATQTWESCRYTAVETAMFVRDHLAPALKAAGLDTKIMIWDHNKEHIFDWGRDMHKADGAAEQISGLAFHWYSGDHFDALRMAHEMNPNLYLIESEYCVGVSHAKPLPDWADAMHYAYDIIGNFNNYMSATVDWNMVLDQKGGPFHARLGGCGSMVHYNTKNDELVKTKIYYAMAHFSKFVDRGAERLGTSVFSRNINAAAFENPDGSIVAVIQNHGKSEKIALRLDNYSADIKLPLESITTIKITNRDVK